jgi:hypothetical protein
VIFLVGDLERPRRGEPGGEGERERPRGEGILVPCCCAAAASPPLVPHRTGDRERERGRQEVVREGDDVGETGQ